MLSARYVIKKALTRADLRAVPAANLFHIKDPPPLPLGRRSPQKCPRLKCMDTTRLPLSLWGETLFSQLTTRAYCSPALYVLHRLVA
jgi:hypothetical protein